MGHIFGAQVRGVRRLDKQCFALPKDLQRVCLGVYDYKATAPKVRLVAGEFATCSQV